MCIRDRGINGVTCRQVSDWHDSDFRQNTMGYDHAISLKPELTGGGLTVEEFWIDGKNYLFKINYSEAELIPTRYDDGEVEITKSDARLYFISLLDSQHSNSFACIYVIICGEDNYGLIQGFTNKYLCSGYRVGEKINLMAPQGQGYFLMNGLIQYCRKYRHVLGINRLELNDESRYECRPRVNIDLIYSNILCGKLPYYMRYGFRPIEDSASDKLKYNLEIIKNKTVTIELLSKLDNIIKRYGQIQIPDNIVEIIKHNNGKKLSECLSTILHEDCVFYARVYKMLYSELGLLGFEGDETAFELYLGDSVSPKTPSVVSHALTN